MSPARRLPPALRSLAAGLALAACDGARPNAPWTLAPRDPPALGATYVLQTVDGGALPARFVRFGENVYRVHADTLRFDLAAGTFRESALIGGRDTTTTDPETVTARALGPLPFTRPSVGEVDLANFLGLGRRTATIQDTGLTVVAMGRQFLYLRVD